MIKSSLSAHRQSWNDTGLKYTKGTQIDEKRQQSTERAKDAKKPMKENLNSGRDGDAGHNG